MLSYLIDTSDKAFFTTVSYTLTNVFRCFGSSLLLDFIPKYHGLSYWLYISILLFLKSSFPVHMSVLSTNYILLLHTLFHFSEFFLFSLLCWYPASIYFLPLL